MHAYYDSIAIFQGTRMEERLDDAINVLRNHAEPQITLGQLPPNLTQHQMTSLGYHAPPSEPHLPDTVKVERATYNTSMLYDFQNVVNKHVCTIL